MTATGLIHAIIDKDNPLTLRQTLLKGAWQMMALVTKRDDDHSQDPPRELQPSFVYYDKALAEAQARLALFAGPVDALRALYDKETADSRQANAEYEATEQAEYDRLKVVRDQIAPLTNLPEGYQQELLRQIDDALEHNDPATMAEFRTNTNPDFDTWRDREWKSAVEKVGRYAGEIEAEKVRTASRNRWLAELWVVVDALPEEENK